MDHEEAGESSSAPNATNSNNGARQGRAHVGAHRTTRQSQPRTNESSGTDTTTEVSLAPPQSGRERCQRNDIPRQQAAAEGVDDGLVEHGWTRVNHGTEIKDFFLVDNEEQLFQGHVTHKKPMDNGMERMSRVVFEDGRAYFYSPHALSLCEQFTDLEAGTSRPKLNHGKVTFGCVECCVRLTQRQEVPYDEWLVKACLVAPKKIGMPDGPTVNNCCIDISMCPPYELADNPLVSMARDVKRKLQREYWRHYPVARCRLTLPPLVERTEIEQRGEVQNHLERLKRENRIGSEIPSMLNLSDMAKHEQFSATKARILKTVIDKDGWVVICYNFWIRGRFYLQVLNLQD